MKLSKPYEFVKRLPRWFLALPIVLAAVGMQLASDSGSDGRVADWSQNLNGALTDLKFKWRGPRAPKQKIVLVVADDDSLASLGRWPWHREVYAELIHSIFKLGANQLGLDVSFSEPEERVPEEIYQLASRKNPEFVKAMKQFEGDPVLAKVIAFYRSRLILGFAPTLSCRPSEEKDCPVKDENLSGSLRAQIGKYALRGKYPGGAPRLWRSPLQSMITVFSNQASFRDASLQAGSFGIEPDRDGTIRQYPLILFHENSLYPSLALAMAQSKLGQDLNAEFSESGQVEKAFFAGDSSNPVPISSQGFAQLNFRGPSGAFRSFSAAQVLQAENESNTEIKRAMEGALVLFGATAAGVYDLRAFPFDPQTPGIEGHATALDNLLSRDFLRSPRDLGWGGLPLVLTVVLGLLAARLFYVFSATASIAIFGMAMAGLGVIDFRILFSNNINFPSAVLLLEVSVLFVFMLGLRYIDEEKNKKFVRETFSKYLAPSVVNLMLQDPKKVVVGGERKVLTILFSDLRNFSELAEDLDPNQVSRFLNDYLSAMTDIVMEHGGTLDKYIGDALMAFWGAPVPMSDHALKAWQAAVAMQKKLKELNPYFEKTYGFRVSCGIGFTSGEVSVGNMGSQKIFEYTVIGDKVNLASRIEGLTRLYGCNILTTQETLNLLPKESRDGLSFRHLDSVRVRGKRVAVKIVEVSEFPYSEKSQAKFELAKAYFLAQKWHEAQRAFAEVNLEQLGFDGRPDGVCLNFVARAEQFKRVPPPADWDGTLEMRRS